MKRIQLLLLAMICTLAAQAQVANGYYRVKWLLRLRLLTVTTV